MKHLALKFPDRRRFVRYLAFAALIGLGASGFGETLPALVQELGGTQFQNIESAG